MLPFLKPKAQAAGIMTIERKPDSTDGESHDDGIDACSHDLIESVHSKNIKAVSAAIKAAFELLDSEPHEEGPHTNEEEEG